jgi:hypothetical protein
MYRRPKFLEVLLKIREEMAREADYDVDFFVEMVRSGMRPATDVRYSIGESENGHWQNPDIDPTKQKNSRSKSTKTGKRG